LEEIDKEMLQLQKEKLAGDSEMKATAIELTLWDNQITVVQRSRVKLDKNFIIRNLWYGSFLVEL
jgi:hypothetical protein